MKESTVVRLPSREGVEDALTEVLRRGARNLIRHAVEAEVAAQLEFYEELQLADGRRRLVRHGHGPEREIVTGIGAVAVRRPKVRDRGARVPGATGPSLAANSAAPRGAAARHRPFLPAFSRKGRNCSPESPQAAPPRSPTGTLSRCPTPSSTTAESVDTRIPVARVLIPVDSWGFLRTPARAA